MSQVQKSNGLRSGKFGGYFAVEMKQEIFFLSHSWLTRAVCAGAEFFSNVYGQPKASILSLKYFSDNIRHLF